MQQFLPFIIAGIAAGSIYGLAATGLVLTYKTSGIFNFGQGALVQRTINAFERSARERRWVAFDEVEGV